MWRYAYLTVAVSVLGATGMSPADEATPPPPSEHAISPQAMQAFSDHLVSLSVRPPRAERLLESARLHLAEGQTEQAGLLLARARQMAAKELHDAFHDSAHNYNETGGNRGPEWAVTGLVALAGSAEAARLSGNFDEAAAQYSTGLVRVAQLAEVVRDREQTLKGLTADRVGLKALASGGHQKIATALQACSDFLSSRKIEEAADRLRYAVRLYALYGEALAARESFEEAFKKAKRADLQGLAPGRYATVDAAGTAAEAVLAGMPADPGDCDQWTAQACAAADAYRRAWAAVPVEIEVENPGLPADIERLLKDVRSASESSQDPRREGLRRLCALMTSRVPGMSPGEIRACVEALVEYADAVPRSSARGFLRALGEQGGKKYSDVWTSLDDGTRRRFAESVMPEGFRVSPCKPPEIPFRETDGSTGFVFLDDASMALFGAMPYRLDVAPDLLPGVPPGNLSMVLVPAGELSIVDDEGKVRVLRNERAFYMHTEEVSKGAYMCYGDATAAVGVSARRTVSTLSSSTAVNASHEPMGDARREVGEALTRWLTEETQGVSVGRGVAQPPVRRREGEDRFALPTLDQWQFAACLHLLTIARAEGVAPTYRWWTDTRDRSGWNADSLHPTSEPPAAGWGLANIFGNVSEIVVVDGGVVGCGGSYASASSPISSYPLYSKPVRPGQVDVGYRLVMLIALGQETTGKVKEPK